MREHDPEIQALSRYLIDEIILAFGLKKTAGRRRAFDLLLNRVTTRLASICVLTDRKIATDGFPAAAGWMASHWVREVRHARRRERPAGRPAAGRLQPRRGLRYRSRAGADQPAGYQDHRQRHPIL